jgi:CIC family chloride channel protein
LWREARINPDALIDRFVEHPPAICRDTDLLSLVLARLKRHRAGAAIVFHGAGRPRAHVGVVTKRAIADAVIENFEV